MKYPIRLFALAAAVALSLACAPGALAAPIVDPSGELGAGYFRPRLRAGCRRGRIHRER